MITLIYHSTWCHNCSTEERILFLTSVRLENIRLNVTGVLLYHEGEIMQIIEGKTDVILQLFEK